MFLAALANASLVDGAIISGLPLRKCAFAARVTQVSVMPQASFERVLPVHGAIISASRSFFGPMGSALGIVWIMSFPVISLKHERQYAASPKRVSKVYEFSDIMGITLYSSFLSLLISSKTVLNVQNEPQTAKPIVFNPLTPSLLLLAVLSDRLFHRQILGQPCLAGTLPLLR